MIKIEDASFSYNGKEGNGIKNVNITIKKGECILLTGRSGCGKTTIIRMINGLIPNFYSGDLRGSIKIDKKNILDMPMYEIAEKVGSVFQNPRTQFFNVDTDSEIAFGIENLSYPYEKLKECVEKTKNDLHIEKLMGRSIFELSGGEKQKIAFSSIYAMSPDIYVLDEPSSNLDVDATMELRDNLMMLKKQGKTIIIAEHRLYYLKDIIDKAVYVDNGEIKKIYTKEEFVEIPEEQRIEMGLRVMNLSSIVPLENKKKSKKHTLKIDNMSTYYKNKVIMDNISVGAARGEIIGIIGHNGAGKSTFLRSVCGLHKGCSGSFLWDGKKVNKKQRLKLSYMVMQDVNYQLFAESVEQECYLGIKNPDTEIVKQVMKELKIYQYKNRHPNTLSGGQKQRTAVAVSMICNKEILVFDEPTSGLDFGSMKQVTKLFTKLASMGKIIFVVTHDYEFISSVCNRIFHFDDGMLKDDFLLNDKNEKKLKEFFIVS
ncbi:ABC transporter ATP-binding protein [Haloimpatiens sp. FM7330]|uniref:ABC transporter ATP-binding protein n=1 Tax=Haloimpatiens sp. FM7330 TaxID=3298610 RepID=UPI0036368563